MSSTQIGRNVAAARDIAGLSQDQLAEAMGEHGALIPRRTLGRIERGEREVRAGELAAISKATGAPVEWLLSGPGWQPLTSDGALGGYLALIA